jgi:tetratricopeptide (TPR) repeat protein
MKHVITALLLTVSIPAYSHVSQPKAKQTVSPEDIKAFIKGRSFQDESDYYKGWTTEPWNGDNKPYAQIRNALTTYKDQGKLASRVALYRKEAAAAPLDSVKQYRWVFAEWKLGKGDKGLLVWRKALSIPISPRTYDYSRLRFLITAENAMTMGKYGGSTELRDAGLRLLKIVPNDKLTSYWVHRIRERTDSLEDKKINLNQALKEVKQNPNDAKAQGLLANAYHNLWMKTRRRSDSIKAVNNFKKYLAMTPANSKGRENVEFWVDAIPKSQARWEANGTGRKN